MARTDGGETGFNRGKPRAFTSGTGKRGTTPGNRSAKASRNAGMPKPEKLSAGKVAGDPHARYGIASDKRGQEQPAENARDSKKKYFVNRRILFELLKYRPHLTAREAQSISVPQIGKKSRSLRRPISRTSCIPGMSAPATAPGTVRQPAAYLSWTVTDARTRPAAVTLPLNFTRLG